MAETPRLRPFAGARRSHEVRPSRPIRGPEEWNSHLSPKGYGGSCQLVEQRLRFFEVDRGESLGEPVVDGREQVASFGAQFPELGLLFPRDASGALRYSFSAVSICPCRSNNWPLILFSSATNQPSPVLLTISKASSNRVKASSICPAISRPGQEGGEIGHISLQPSGTHCVKPLRNSDTPSAIIVPQCPRRGLACPKSSGRSIGSAAGYRTDTVENRGALRVW